MSTIKRNFCDFNCNLHLNSHDIEPNFTYKRSLQLIAIYYSVTIIINIFISLVISLIIQSLKSLGIIVGDRLFLSISNTLTYITCIACLVPFCFNILKSDINDFIKKPIKSITIVLMFFLLFWVIDDLYYQYIQPFIIKTLVNLNVFSIDLIKDYQTSANQSGIEDLLKEFTPAVITIPAIVLIGPITEEIIFRKSLFKLLDKVPCILKILISSVAFTLIHIMIPIATILIQLLIKDPTVSSAHLLLELIYSVGYFIPGILLGTFYIFTGHNVTSTTIVHILYNLFLLIDILTKNTLVS